MATDRKVKSTKNILKPPKSEKGFHPINKVNRVSKFVALFYQPIMLRKKLKILKFIKIDKN
jgi:hypothetical protein